MFKMSVLKSFLVLISMAVILTVLFSTDYEMRLHVHSQEGLEVESNEPENDIYSNVDCSKAPNGTEKTNLRALMSEREIIKRTGDCDMYFKLFRVFANEEKATNRGGQRRPKIAFSHQVHKEIGIFELFLSILYRYVCK